MKTSRTPNLHLLFAFLLTLCTAAQGCGSAEEVGEGGHAGATGQAAAVDQAPDEHGHGEGTGHGNGEAESPAEEDVLGRVTIPDDALEPNGVTTAIAAPGIVPGEIELPGEIILNADRVAHIVPRFPGIVHRVNHVLGSRVHAGDVLAVIQSNQSAAPYDVTALIDGIVVEKHVTLGEFVRDDADIFVVADLSTVWVNISVYARFLPVVKVGQRVRVTAPGLDEAAEGRIDYVGPIIGESTRTGVARVVLSNQAGSWQPGLFINAHITVEETRAAVAVPEGAVQTVDGRNVVFVKSADGTFEVRTVEPGRLGGGVVEITHGLQPGEEYVASGSFIFKAEFGKSEAEHDH